MKHLKDVGVLRWGLFSKDIPGICGYRCNQKYTELLNTGYVLDANQFWDQKTKKFVNVTSSKKRLRNKYKKNHEKLKLFSFFVRHDPSGILPDNFTHPKILPEIKSLFNSLNIPNMEIEPLYRLDEKFHKQIVKEFPRKRAKKGSRKKILSKNVSKRKKKIIVTKLREMHKRGLRFRPNVGKRNLIQKVEYKYIRKENEKGIYSLVKYHNEFYAHLGPFSELTEAKKYTVIWLNNTRFSFESLKTLLCEKYLELQNEKIYIFCKWIHGLISFENLKKTIPEFRFNEIQRLNISKLNNETKKVTKDDLKKIFNATLEDEKGQILETSKIAFNALRAIYKFRAKLLKRGSIFDIIVSNRCSLKKNNYREGFRNSTFE